MQRIGVILIGVDTQLCTVGSPCAAIDATLYGFYRLQFDPNKCGPNADDGDGDWCKARSR